jgi:hypothetical protein
MFGYAAGATPQVRAKMIAERAPAQREWPFLTSLDLSAVHNELQLVSMVKDRTGSTLAEAQDDVRRWMKGYTRRVADGGSVPATSTGSAVAGPVAQDRAK